MTRKGQITLESLLLYGVAILVVLLAVGALTYFGVLDLGRILPDRCDLASAGTLACEEWSIVKTNADGSGTVTLGIRNVGAKSLTVYNATYVPDGTGTGVECSDPSASGPLIRSGAIEAVTLTCPAGALYQNAGQKSRGNLVIDFMFDDGAIVNPVGGQIVATVSES